MPKVTIIVPSYNHSQFLNERLSTIINQTFQDFELIIIDDYSTDNSQEILQKFVTENQSKVSHFIINDKNSGSGYNSWKKGIARSLKKFIPDGTKVEKASCENCGESSSLAYVEGCLSCNACGHSKCG